MILTAKITSREILKQSERFLSERVIASGKEYLLKLALKPELNDKIAQQVRGASELEAALRQNNITGVHAEKIVESGADWLASEWLGPTPIATPEQFMERNNLSALDDLVYVAAQMDKLAEAELPTTAGMPIKLSSKSIPAEEYVAKVNNKFVPLFNKYKWDRHLIDQALSYVKERWNSWQASWQHGDLEPWHIFKQGSEYVLIDCEHASSAWPRFYDIANFYSKLIVRFDLKPQADKVVEDFSRLRRIKLKDSEAFWACVVLRTTNRIAEHHEEAKVVDRAFKLLDNILK